MAPPSGPDNVSTIGTRKKPVQPVLPALPLPRNLPRRLKAEQAGASGLAKEQAATSSRNSSTTELSTDFSSANQKSTEDLVSATASESHTEQSVSVDDGNVAQRE